MKYVFCSLMFDNVEEDIKNSTDPNTVSGHKFQENLLRGLLQNGKDVCVLNIPRVRHYPDYPQKKLEERIFRFEGQCVGQSIGFNNRFLISYISQFFSLKKALDRVVMENDDDQITMLVFNSHLIQMLNLLRLRRNHKNIIVCDVIGDLHGKFGMLGKKATLKERLVDIYGQVEDFLAKKADCYVFLSKYMKEAIPCKESQYVVLEGMYNSNIVINVDEATDSNERVLLYAGTLDVEYDIEHLINAFLMTSNSNYRLLIAGNGNYVNNVKEAAQKDERIKYLGVLSPEDLLEYQKNATALISPRKNSHRYVKYSFPSKTMECLAIGKPFIAHKLDSEPDEYSNYIQYAEESDEGLARKISEVLSLPEKERKDIGKKSQHFIVTFKNPKEMCKRIIDLCEAKGVLQ